MAPPRASAAIAEFLTGTTADDIPEAAYRKATDLAINLVGITIGGATEPTATIFTSLVREMGGTPEASVAGGGFRTSAPMAAYANGNAAHTFDMDDTYWPGLHHPSVGTLPAILALAEARGASGRDVMAAYILGLEVTCRLGDVVGSDHYLKGFHATGTLGTYGALAGCAWLLGLNVDQIRSALGIAVSLTSGSRQSVGWMAKPLHAGNAAKNGLLAAVLAGRGFLGDPDSVEGEAGFVRTFNYGASIQPWEPVTERLGKPWAVLDPGITIKSSPCNTAAGVAGHSALALANEAGVSAEEIERIEMGTNPIIMVTSKYPIPQLTHQAKYSVPYVIAAGLLDRTLGPEQFLEKRITQPDVQDLLRRVKLYVHDELQSPEPAYYSKCLMRLILKNGRVLERWFDWAKGAPDAPLTRDELRSRFEACARFGLGPDDLPRAFDTAARLAELESIEPLMDFIRGG